VLVELRALEYFVAIVTTGSFTAAAESCLVAQPSISYQVAALERELGEPLFVRTPRGATLTPGGRALLPHARACLESVAAAKREFAQRAELLTGELAIGTVGGVQETRLPRVLAQYHALYPGVAVRLSSGGSDPLIQAVDDGGLDAALVALPEAPLPASLAHATLVQDEIVAVLAAERPVSGGALTCAEVLTHPVITYASDSALRHRIEEHFRANGEQLQVSHATNDVALQIALAREGVGVALAAAPAAGPALPPRGRPRGRRPPLRFRKVLVWRSDPAQARPLLAFLQLWSAAGGPDARHPHAVR
jgi:DNA-binding transcriptional LysR family regulator